MNKLKNIVLDKDYTGKMVFLNLDGIEYDSKSIDKYYTSYVGYFSNKKIIIVSNVDFSDNTGRITISSNGEYDFDFGCHREKIRVEHDGFLVEFN